jgi:hypothetical protein
MNVQISRKHYDVQYQPRVDTISRQSTRKQLTFEQTETYLKSQELARKPSKAKSKIDVCKYLGNTPHLSKSDLQAIIQCIASRATFPPKKCGIDGCPDSFCQSHPSRFASGG